MWGSHPFGGCPSAPSALPNSFPGKLERRILPAVGAHQVSSSHRHPFPARFLTVMEPHKLVTGWTNCVGLHCHHGLTQPGVSPGDTSLNEAQPGGSLSSSFLLGTKRSQKLGAKPARRNRACTGTSLELGPNIPSQAPAQFISWCAGCCASPSACGCVSAVESCWCCCLPPKLRASEIRDALTRNPTITAGF